MPSGRNCAVSTPHDNHNRTIVFLYSLGDPYNTKGKYY